MQEVEVTSGWAEEVELGIFGGLPLKVQKAREDLEDIQRRLLLLPS